MKKIERLTAEQESQLSVCRDRWLQIGLSCEPANRTAAVAGANAAYVAAGLPPPKFVVWLDSPLSGAYGAAMLKNLPAQVWAQVRAQVWAQVRDQVGAQVGAQVRDQVWAQVRDQVGAQVWAQVRDQVRDQVWAQAGAQVWAQVGAQVGAQVRDQVWAQAGDQVWAQVRDQVGAQVRDQVWAQVRDQVGAQVWAQVGAQVRDQVWAQAGAQAGDQVWDQVRDQVGAQVWAQVGAQAGDQVSKAGYGSHDANWLAFYEFMQFAGVPEASMLNGLQQIAQASGWFWPFQNLVILTERHNVLRRDANNRLHCEDGPAIAYRDGFKLYRWHGVTIPAEWVEGKPPTAKEAITWPNIEQRRAACELVGWAKILKELNARVIDADGDDEIGTLLEVDIPDSGKERFLKVQCGTKREFALPVPRDMKTAIQANAWTYGLNPEEFSPEVRT